MTTHSHLDATTQTWRKPDEPRAFTLKFDQSKFMCYFPTLSDLEESFHTIGHYTLTWHDEMEQAE